MDWIQLNLDAYRIVAEIATTLRDEIQRTLDKELGASWHDTGLPEGMKEQLVARKERESEIAWHETEYQEIINYTSFSDLYAIIDKHAELFPQVTSLASNPALLVARFLELGVLTDKIANSRAISEAELSYISSFHQRFLKTLSEAKALGAAKQAASAKEEKKDKSEKAEKKEEAEEVEIVEPEQEEPAQTPTAAKQVAPPQRQEKPSDRKGSEQQAGQAQPKEKDKPAAKDAPPGPAKTGKPSVKNLEKALEESDTKVLLKELYREVTTIADSVWTSDMVPQPFVWQHVSTSDWYSESFAKLGLKPLSDFYEIMSQVDERMDKGLTKNQLQELLQQLQFAQVLLALRDMFQRNNV